MNTAFVLTGGGSLGAIQVGMLQALAEHGIEPDVLIGTSVGALNASWVATHGTAAADLQALADLWCGLTRREVFPLQAPRVLRALTGRGKAWSPPTRSECWWIAAHQHLAPSRRPESLCTSSPPTS